MRCILNVQAIHELAHASRSGLKSLFLPHCISNTWECSTGIHTAGLQAEQLQNQFSSAEEDIFLFLAQSRPATQLTLPPVIWVPGTHSSELWARIITFNNNWRCTFFHTYIFVVWCLIKHSENFTLSTEYHCTVVITNTSNVRTP